MKGLVVLRKQFSLGSPDLSLHVILLLMGSMTMLILGALLFPVAAGKLPYYEKGVYGLLLFILALQMVTLGETPFGNMEKSKPLLGAGALMASFGIVTGFIPEVFGQIPRGVLFICFTPGGLFLLTQMLFSREKLQSWKKYGGIFRHLIYACGGVYTLSVFVGVLLWNPRFLTTPQRGLTALLFGGFLCYLVIVLHTIYRAYPEARKMYEARGPLEADQTVLLLTGLFMILLGVLLVPVSFGKLPFSGSAQLGLLMVIFAIQMLAFGNTPLGAFPRSWIMIFLGFLFGGLGIASCILPGVLVAPLTVLVGGLNVLGGSINLLKLWIPFLGAKTTAKTPLPKILLHLYSTQTAMNLLSILFGTSMFFSGLLPGYVIGVVLAGNGGALLYLLRLILLIEEMKRSEEVSQTEG
jgi:hypothetical protein